MSDSQNRVMMMRRRAETGFTSAIVAEVSRENLRGRPEKDVKK